MEVRFLEVTSVQPEHLALWESWLAPEKRQRIDRLPERNRLLSLCGDGLAREMLSEKLGIPPEEISFTFTVNGKPMTPGAHFSISHSGDMVGCAVSEREVGLDIEQLRPVPHRLGRALAGEWESREDFWRLWTGREAAIKCLGGKVWDWKRAEDADHVVHPELPGYAVTVCEQK